MNQIKKPQPKTLLITLFVAIFAVTGAYMLYKAFAAAQPLATIEAEQMSVPNGAGIITNSSASGGKALALYSNGTASGNISLPSRSDSIQIVAKGSQCRGAPTMSLSIDGKTIGNTLSVSSTSWTTYTVTPSSGVGAGTHTISITFNNDRTRRNCSRDLYLDVTKLFGPTQTTTTPAPTVTLSATPNSVIAGASSTLTWSSTNATSCTASGAWSGARASAGSVSTGALNQSSSYNLSCTGESGTAQANTSVTVTTTTTGSPQPLGVTGNWTLKFKDEFDGTTLNKSVWSPGWFSTGISGPVNDLETACYDPTLLTMPGDGSLHMKMILKTNSCKGKSRPYTGSLISSNPKDYVSGHAGYEFTYGYKESRMYLPPAANGQVANWPGFWANGQVWPNDGEDDVMEGLGGQACYHYHSTAGGPGGCAAGNYSGWHVFGSYWQPGSVTYYYDGKQVGKLTTGISSSPQYLIFQSTTSADSPTIVPADVMVDYVRVWQ